MIRLLLFILLSVARLFAADFSFDFRESHNLDEVLENSDQLPILEDRGENGKVFYTANASIRVILPGGQIIRTTSQALMIDVTPEGNITVFKISGPIMPLDEVYETSKILYSVFGVPHDRLEKWKSIADSEGSSAQTVLGGNYDGMYPPVYINVMHSMNKLYPWTISLSFGWNQIKDDQRDEAWGRENNPKPPPGLEIVSLEPPSGKTYDRADAWVEANRRQDELDKKLGQVRRPDGQLISGPQDPPKERAEKPRSSVAVKPTDVITEKSSPFPLWIIVSSIGILIFALTIWLHRRNSKPNS
jgi:hypothetical protein